MKGNVRIVIPFHSGNILHPKITKQVFIAIGKLCEGKPSE
jgi:predicted RNA binding protein YcfA (HicA-like mRNA interferase family)